MLARPYARTVLSFFAGLGLGLSLIIAIGAQNVFVLRQGLKREHVLPVVIICAISDAVLIIAGVIGLGFLIETAPWLVPVARWLGGGFLVFYGLLAARRAWKPSGETLLVETTEAQEGADAAASGSSSAATLTAPRTVTHARLGTVLLTALALTWLNPNVYLDTVLMLGSIASTHGDTRWMFAAGAVLASFLWFFALGFGARYLGRWLRTPRAWRMLDAGIAVLMLVLGVNLVLPVFYG